MAVPHRKSLGKRTRPADSPLPALFVAGDAGDWAKPVFARAAPPATANEFLMNVLRFIENPFPNGLPLMFRREGYRGTTMAVQQVSLPLRLESDQHGIIFAKVELLLEVSVAADLHGADFQRRAAVFGFDFSDLRLGQLRGRA